MWPGPWQPAKSDGAKPMANSPQGCKAAIAMQDSRTKTPVSQASTGLAESLLDETQNGAAPLPLPTAGGYRWLL